MRCIRTRPCAAIFPSGSIGVRPEHLGPARSNAAQPLGCQVDIVEPTGPDTYLMTWINDTRVTTRCVPSAAPAAGERMPIDFDLSAAVFFDAETEERVA